MPTRLLEPEAGTAPAQLERTQGREQQGPVNPRVSAVSRVPGGEECQTGPASIVLALPMTHYVLCASVSHLYHRDADNSTHFEGMLGGLKAHASKTLNSLSQTGYSVSTMYQYNEYSLNE